VSSIGLKALCPQNSGGGFMPRGNRRKPMHAPFTAESISVLGKEAGSVAPPVADSQFVEALARGLRVLQSFRHGDDHGLSNKELSARTGLSAPTVSRLCHTLQRLGYLVYDSHNGRYAMGPAILNLSYTMLHNLDLRDIARPLLREFAEATRVTVAINARDRLRMVVLEGVSGTSPVALRLEVGSRIPVFSTAAGRAYLAGLIASGAQGELADIRAADATAWDSNQAGIERACTEIASRGFCITQSGWQRDINGVALPLSFRSGGGQLSLSCGGPAQELSMKRMEREIGPLLLDIAGKIQKRLPH